MFRFLFPKQAARLEVLEGNHAALLQRLDEIYAYLGVYRDGSIFGGCELRKGSKPALDKSPWIDLITPTPFPSGLGFTKAELSTTVAVPKKRKPRAKRKKA